MVKRAVALEIIFTSLYLESVLRNAMFGELCEVCSLYVLRNNMRGNGDSSIYRMTYLVTAISVTGEECEPAGKNAWFLSPSICLHSHINSTQGTWERQQGDSPESHSDAASGGEGSSGLWTEEHRHVNHLWSRQESKNFDLVKRPCLSIAGFSSVMLLTFSQDIYLVFPYVEDMWEDGDGERDAVLHLIHLAASVACPLDVCSTPSYCDSQQHL